MDLLPGVHAATVDTGSGCTTCRRYAAAGGRVRTELFDGCGHSPHLEARERWLAVFTAFLASCADAG